MTIQSKVSQMIIAGSKTSGHVDKWICQKLLFCLFLGHLLDIN